MRFRHVLLKLYKVLDTGNKNNLARGGRVQFLCARTGDLCERCVMLLPGADVQTCTVCVCVCARPQAPAAAAASGPDSSGADEREAALRHMVVSDPDGSCLSLE